MTVTVTTYLIVCPLVFLAGFVDSIAGGGGLISLPAYLFAGLPPHYAMGTNKVANCLGTAVAAGKYIRDKKVRMKIALFAGAGALLGGTIGSAVALYISETALRAIMLIALPCVAVFLATRKTFGSEETQERTLTPFALAAWSAAIGLGMGAYDGLVGPGTGTFMILGFTGILGLDLLTSSGCAKVGNLASNLGSVAVFLLGGKVLLAVALPAALCSMAGNYLGARTAIKGGTKYVRAVIFAVLGM
ncbi:MAG TPA: TSUP family transporter, partial [Terriglobales bacterium]|nr:TSUP family transporter [Terriglobales bacterium]